MGSKCKCGKSEMVFKYVSGMDGKWECPLCKDLEKAPKVILKEEALKEQIIGVSEELPKQVSKKKSRRSKKQA